MAKYRKKPVIIEAEQWTGTKESFNKIQELNINNKKHIISFGQGNNEMLLIPTLEGEMTASFNDFIIKGVKGEIYPCKPDIFKKTYELVES